MITKKTSTSSSNTSSSYIFSKNNASNNASYSDKKRTKKPSLVYKEVDKPKTQNYSEYKRKHLAEEALWVGNTAKYIKSIKSEKNSKKNTRLSKNLSDSLACMKVRKSLTACGCKISYINDDSIKIKRSEIGKYRLSGLQNCGNNASCPVCAKKLAKIRSSELEEMLKVGRENNRSYIMIVTTIPHKPMEALEITLNQVIKMNSYIFNSKEWKQFKKLTQCRFVNTSLENMVSFKNGLVDWHPHKNSILDFDVPMSKVMSSLAIKNEEELRFYISTLFTSIGQRYLRNNKIKKKLLKPYFKKNKDGKNIIKGGVTATTEFSNNYISKWGDDVDKRATGWGIGEEMTLSIYKNGRLNESVHPFKLLDMTDKNNVEVSEGQRNQAIHAFQEFVVASRGKKWFTFGRGALKYYNEKYGTKIRVKEDKEALENAEDEGETIATFTALEWLLFKPTTLKIYKGLSQGSDKKVIKYFKDEIEKNKNYADYGGEIVEDFCEITGESFKCEVIEYDMGDDFKENIDEHIEAPTQKDFFPIAQYDDEQPPTPDDCDIELLEELEYCY